MVIAVMSKQIRAKKGSSKTFKAVEGKQLTEEQISQFIEFFNKYNTIPGNKIVCVATGKLTTCVGPWKDKKIKEYGGVENLLRKYKRKEASVKERVAKIVEAKREIFDLPKMSFAKPQPLTAEQLAQDSKSLCLRPDIYLTNGRHCDGCGYFSICLNKRKSLPTYLKKAA